MFILSIALQELVWGTQILLVAVSLYLVVTASRIFHLALGAIGAAAAYGVYWGVSAGYPLVLALGLGAAIAIILGLVSAFLLEAFAKRQEPLLGLLASFALGVVIESAIAMLFGSDGKNLQAGILPVITLGSAQLDLPGFITILIGLGIACAAWVAVSFTGAGRLFRGVAENSSLTTSFGLDSLRLRQVTYCIAALVAAVVVTLSGWHTALTPLMGFHLVVAAFIALLAGGITDLRGTIIASYLLALIPGFIIAFSNNLSQNWRMVFVFFLAALLLAFRPQGLFGKNDRKA